MYNRYIPQPDGSFRRDLIRTPEPPAPAPRPPRSPQQPPCPEPPQAPPRPQQRKEPRRQQKQSAPPPSGDSISGFFKNLLPGDLDTGDLLVIVLLLLMAGDCREDQNHALLTLVLYLFL